MDSKVIANSSCAISVSGVFHTIIEGHSYDADSPLVAEHPWAFEQADGDTDGRPTRAAKKAAAPRRGRRAKVEQATADPADLA